MSTSDSTDCALSLAPSRAPYRARARARPSAATPTSTARRPARSERPAEKAWGVSSHAAQPPALSRWRRGHIHFSPAARPLPQAGSPEWSVASDAEGGSGERGGPVRTHLSTRLRRSDGHSPSWRTQKGRGRLGRPPTPQAPQGRGAQRWSRDAERPRAFRECRCRRIRSRY
jgi:hypothetical protein